jgi:hypothetical protein
MWLTAVLASALVRLATVLTVTGGNDGSGGEGGGEDGGDGGEGGKVGGKGGGGDGGGEGSGDGIDGVGGVSGVGKGGGNGARPGGCGGKDGGGGAWQVRTEPSTPVRVVAQEQTVPSMTKTFGPWEGSGEREGTKEVTKARHPKGAPMGNYEDERARSKLCWSRSGSSRLTLRHPRHRRRHRPANNEQL